VATPSWKSFNLMSKSQTIFHFPFEIFHLSSGRKHSPGWRVIVTITSPGDTKARAAGSAMTNEKSKIENGKWFDSYSSG
jgi:hypothetical protein